MLLAQYNLTNLPDGTFDEILDYLNETLSQKGMSGVNSQTFLGFGPGCLRLEQLHVVQKNGSIYMRMILEVDVTGLADCAFNPFNSGDKKYDELPLTRMDFSPIENLGDPDFGVAKLIGFAISSTGDEDD